MTPSEKLIATALGQVGYLEKATNAQLDDPTANAGNKNFTKYARDLDKLEIYNGRKNGYAWCDVFVDWCFLTTFGVEPGLKLLCQEKGSCGAGVKYSAQYYQWAGRFVGVPQTGDQIFFFGADGKSWAHTGIVVKVDRTRVYTVEGNTSGASGVVANGGGVCRKSYALTDKSIAGYGRPDWTLIPAEGEQDAAGTSFGEAGRPSRQPDGCPWYAEAQRWAKDNGIADGTRPQDPATRAEVWTMLKRLKEGI